MNKFLGCLIFAFIAYQTISAQISCGVIFGKAIHLPKPIYSENIKFTNDIEMVEVKIEIDEKGYVTSAKTISGNPDFSAISETAAINSRFSPAFPKIKATGTIKYEFDQNRTIKVSESIKYNTDEWKKRTDIECGKIFKIYSFSNVSDYTIWSIVLRLSRNQMEPSPFEIGFVINGKAKIGIKLKELNSRSIKKLKSLGLEIIHKISSEKAIIGQIPIEKIESLLELNNIVYVFPFWVKPPPPVVI